MPTERLVHVVDDDEAVRESLEFLFDSAGLSARAHASAVAFLGSLEPGARGCVVTDIRMPEMSGLDLLRELKRRKERLQVIVITGHGDVPLAVEAMKSGAFDFLEKPFDDERLLGLVSRALEARPDADPDPANPETAGARQRLARLSNRERQVLRGLVEGQLNKTIAWELGISARTVEVYRAKLMQKMEAPSFADLVRLALLAGPIQD